MTDQPSASAAPAECMNLDHYEERCPGCGGKVGWETCHMTYTTWKCFGCGADLDGRVTGPTMVHREDVTDE